MAKKMEIHRTSDLRKEKGIMNDWIADGFVITILGDKVPCKIGYSEMISSEEVEADTLFFKDFIAESGNHYQAETIPVDRFWHEVYEEVI